MKPLARWSLNAFAALSLLLCVATLGLWVRSYIYGETLHWYGDGRELSLMSDRGQVDWYRVWSSDLRSRPTEFTYWRHKASGFQRRVDLLSAEAGMWHVGPMLGFAFFEQRPTPYSELFVEVMAPWWMLTLITAAFPVMRLRCWLTRSAAKQGFCSCGYDLRATPDRCPECGTMITKMHG
jgi:hypothetical protein